MKKRNTRKRESALGKPAAAEVGGAVVLKLRIAGKICERLNALGATELEAIQQFLARSLHEYLDRNSPEPRGCGPNPVDPTKPISHLKKVSFGEMEGKVPPDAGIYEIHTLTGIPLKVGISGNLRKRLMQHRASRQSGLKLREGGQRSDPKDVDSKASILAKHLYYDTTLVAEFDLTSETERRRFLREHCYFAFEQTANKAEARKLEGVRERELPFRYIGHVKRR